MRRLAAWAAIVLASFFALAWIVAASDSFQACLAGDTDSLDETSFVRRTAEVIDAPTTLQCVGNFLDQNETTILALAALAMVFFGLALWGIGTRVQRAFLAQVPARAEAARTQLRAQVGVEAIQLGGPNVLSVTVKNFGPTAAQHVRVAVLCVAQPPDAGALGKAVTAAPDFTLFSGQSLTITVSAEGAEAAAAIERAQAGAALYVCGHIRYADVYNRRWRTNFCRASHSSGGLHSGFAVFGALNDEVREP